MHARFAAALCLALTIAAAGCGGVIDPSKNIDEPFSGVLDIGGADTHQFNSKNGEFEIRITALDPPNVFLGVGYGPVSGSNCSLTSAFDFGQINRAAIAGAINSGRHCVHVYDSGSLTGPTSYTIVVSHP